MSIAQRLYLLIGTIAAGLAVLGSLGIVQMGRIYEAANYANINTVPSLVVLDDAYVSLSRMRVGVWKHIALTDPAALAAEDLELARYDAEVRQALARYEREDITDQRDRDLLGEDLAALGAYENGRLQVLALSSAGKKDEARELQLTQQAVIRKVDNAIAAHRAYNAELGNKAAAQGAADLRTAIWGAVATIGIAIVAMAGMGIMLACRIAGSLRRAVAVARSVAAGDLTGAIPVVGNDEVAQLMAALRDMNGNLVGIVSQVREGTDTIATASSQIAAGNADLSARTEQQAGSLEETASSMEELTSTIKQNSDNALQANSLASAASDVALSGGAIVSQVVDKMSAISESSHKISQIIGVIDGIAFQTNILALNAAVEAARAGEQGRGFAVVATEVRNLAQRSASAAKEIKGLIDDSTGHVNAGTRLVEDAGMAMRNIVDSVRRVTVVVGEITTASREQSSGVEQVNRAIIEIDGATQQNAALVEQAAAAASSMQEQAGELARVVGVFKLSGAPTPRA